MASMLTTQTVCVRPVARAALLNLALLTESVTLLHDSASTRFSSTGSMGCKTLGREVWDFKGSN